VRDGAFDIGMFRSYWERAAKVTGERIADLSARPLAASAEASDPTTPSPHSGDEPATSSEPLSHLSGLISGHSRPLTSSPTPLAARGREPR